MSEVTKTAVPETLPKYEHLSTGGLRQLCRDNGWRGLSCAMATKAQCIEYLRLPINERDSFIIKANGGVASVTTKMAANATAASMEEVKTPEVIAKPKYVLPPYWSLAEDVFTGIVAQMKKTGDAVHRVLLYGPAGTSKTTFAWMKLKELMGGDESKIFMDTCQEDTPATALLGSYIPEAEGKWSFVLGYGPNAFNDGALLINEIDKGSVAYWTECYKLADDRKVALIRTPDGRVYKPHDKYMFVATMNGRPDDLPEALADRFDVKIYIKSPHPAAIEALSPDLRGICLKAYSNPEKVDISYRAFRSFDRLRSLIGEEKAGSGVFGAQWNDVKSAIKLSKAGK